jgi:hypothetical protein
MGKNLIAMCARCKKIRIEDGKWIEEDDSHYDLLSKDPEMSDGYCPECVEFYRREHKKLKQMYGVLRN